MHRQNLLPTTLIFWTLLLLLPTQLGKHFWPDSAFIFGIRVDYLSPTVYLTDIVVVVLMVAWGIGGIRGNRGNRRIRAPRFLIPLLLLFFLVLLPSLLLAQNQPAAIYKLLKIIELLLLGIYVYYNQRTILGSGLWRLILSATVLYTSFLGIFQSFVQHSLGSMFWWLGERTFTATDPGIALARFGGQEFLRPYSTFSHPNSFAGFLLVVLILLFPPKSMFRKVVYFFGLAAILLSFSQNVWLAGALMVFLFLLKKAKHFLKLPVVSFTILGVFSIFPALWSILPFAKNIEIVLRQELLFAGEKMFLGSPIFGVGLNNFINKLPYYGSSPTVSWWLQPVHNIFVLWTVETGVVGLLFLVYFLWWFFKKWEMGNLHFAVLAIFLTGLFDHYWLTLQQNQLLLAIVLGALSRYTVSSKNA